jgi:hypothetical protein
MSKRFKGKICVYCCEKSSADGDHVFSRQFLLEADRINLPKVPSCRSCNKEKSDLEHYLTAILPFAGRHDKAITTLETLVPKRLAKNLKLHRSLSESRKRADVGGEERLMLAFEPDRLTQLFAMIAKGLTWLHWQTYLPVRTPIRSLLLTEQGASVYDRLFRLAEINRVKESLGDNSVIYEGVQQRSAPTTTAWRFWMYGGIELTGDPEAPDLVASQILVTTGLPSA